MRKKNPVAPRTSPATTCSINLKQGVRTGDNAKQILVSPSVIALIGIGQRARRINKSAESGNRTEARW